MQAHMQTEHCIHYYYYYYYFVAVWQEETKESFVVALSAMALAHQVLVSRCFFMITVVHGECGS